MHSKNGSASRRMVTEPDGINHLWKIKPRCPAPARPVLSVATFMAGQHLLQLRYVRLSWGNERGNH